MLTDDIRSAYTRSKWALGLRGLLGIVLGIVIITRPLASIAAFALVIALWALIDGMTNIVRAFQIRGYVAHWWVLLLAGVVSVAFGVGALYYYPVLSLSFAVVWAAFWLLTAGAIAAYVAIQERRVALPWGWTMILGVLTILAGCLAIAYPGITLAGLISLIAAMGIVGGSAMLVGAARLQSFERDVKDAVQPVTDRRFGRAG